MLTLLITIVIVGLIVGLIVWLVGLTSIDERFKRAITAIAIVLALIWVITKLIRLVPS